MGGTLGPKMDGRVPFFMGAATFAAPERPPAAKALRLGRGVITAFLYSSPPSLMVVAAAAPRMWAAARLSSRCGGPIADDAPVLGRACGGVRVGLILLRAATRCYAACERKGADWLSTTGTQGEEGESLRGKDKEERLSDGKGECVAGKGERKGMAPRGPWSHWWAMAIEHG